MAQSEKSLAVASGARRPDGEGCKYGLSQNHKKNKNFFFLKNDRHATIRDVTACVSLLEYWSVMKFGHMES